jgi:hypothetical protein
MITYLSKKEIQAIQIGDLFTHRFLPLVMILTKPVCIDEHGGYIATALVTYKYRIEIHRVPVHIPKKL